MGILVPRIAPMTRLVSRENWLLLLLVFLPVALLLEYVFHAAELWVFLASAAAIIPLAALMVEPPSSSPRASVGCWRRQLGLSLELVHDDVC